MEATKHQITDPAFFTGGNAYFTVSNGKGKRYTYRIRKHPDSPFYFVSLLTGSDNSRNYTYMGLYNPQTGNVSLTKKSKFNYYATPYKVVCWAIKKVRHCWPFPEGYACEHEGRCARCGRRLTVPESIRSGFGPECAKR